MSDNDAVRRLQEAQALNKVWRANDDPLVAELRALALDGTARQEAEAANLIRQDLRAGELMAREEALRIQIAMQDALAPLNEIRETLALGLAKATLPFETLQAQFDAAFAGYRDVRIDFALDLPTPIEIPELARIAARISAVDFNFDQVVAFQETLKAQMTAVTAPWVVADWPDLSALAFGRVSAEAATLLQASAFSDGREKAARSLFGAPLEAGIWIATNADPDARDEARVEGGADPALLVIPNSARLTVGASVGLIIPAPETLRIRPLEGGEVVFSSLAGDWMRAAEIKLRFFVVAALRQAFGEQWMAQLPPDLEPQWTQSRDRQVKAGRPEYALFHYANLGDWSKIINRHWSAIFAPVFLKKSHLETTFEQLLPLRNEDGHHRPSGSLDEMVAITYCRQIIERVDAWVLASGWPPLGD
jgi:hypothetical protein